MKIYESTLDETIESNTFTPTGENLGMGCWGRVDVYEEQDGAVGLLYEHNSQFIQEIVDRVYFGAKTRGIPSLYKEDLAEEAAIVFMANLTKKTPKVDLRSFVYQPIYKALIDLNRQKAREARKEHSIDRDFLDILVAEAYEREQESI